MHQVRYAGKQHDAGSNTARARTEALWCRQNGMTRSKTHTHRENSNLQDEASWRPTAAEQQLSSHLGKKIQNKTVEKNYRKSCQYVGRTNKFHWKALLGSLILFSKTKPAWRNSACWWRGLLQGTEAPNCQCHSKSWKPAACLELRSRMSWRHCQNS